VEQHEVSNFKKLAVMLLCGASAENTDTPRQAHMDCGAGSPALATHTRQHSIFSGKYNKHNKCKYQLGSICRRIER